jgi:protein SCO1/2
MRALLVLMLLWLAGAAGAQPLALPPPPQASLQQRVGAVLPLATPVRDDLGQAARLADFFRPHQPVLLVLGYYRCPQLCGLVMHSLLQALRDTGMAPTGWRIVGLSIDPQDTPADAHRRRDLDLAYAHFLADARTADSTPRIDLLVADRVDVQRIAQAVGFSYRPQQGDPIGYAHPATVVVLTPAGTVSRYFNGVGIEGEELRGALVEAADGAVGSLSERLAVLCAHFDPALGRHTATVMNALRAIALLTLAALGAIGWRHRGARNG